MAIGSPQKKQTMHLLFSPVLGSAIWIGGGGGLLLVIIIVVLLIR
jgi:cellobiose-specific phosphotransferase system component IIC